MTNSRWCSRIGTVFLLSLLLALAACTPAGGGAAQGNGAPTAAPTTAAPTPTPTPALPTPTPTQAPSPTPTLAPPVCNANFPNPPVYYNTLPDANFKATSVYAQVKLPPLTRSYDNDAAGGVRGRQMCSAGTPESVLNFMAQHLTQLGWKQVDTNGLSCLNAGSFYGKPQCWKNGTYLLFLGINSSTDWIILFRDPDFQP